MATISDNNVILRLILKAKEYRNGLKDAEKETSSLGKSISNLKKSVGKAIAAKLTIDLIKSLQKTSLEMDALDKKANIVFGKTLPLITKAAKENARELGLTTNEYIKSAAAIQDLLIPMEFTREEAAKISTELVGLSGALSEWTGGQRTSAEVSEILNKALLGEREQLKSLGISIQEADVNGRLLEKGQNKLTGTLLQQAKAQATLELITEKSSDAQAAFTENAGSATRQSAKLGAALRQITEDISRALEGVFETAGNLIDGDRLVSAIRKTIAQIGGFFSGLGSVITNGVNVAKRSVLEIEKLFLKAQKLGEGIFGAEEVARAIQKDIDAINNRQKELVENGKSFGDAYNETYNNIFKRFEVEVKESAESAAKKVGGSFTRALTKEQKKAVEEYRINVKKAESLIIDLQNELIGKSEERAAAQAKTAAKRTIDGLVGTKGQIKKQTDLINELLKQELAKISFSGDDVQLLESDFLTKQIESLSKTEPIKLNLTSVVEFEDTEGFGEKLGKLFDPESENNKKLREGLGALQEITSSIFAADDKATEAKLANIDSQIEAADERIKRAVEGGKEGSEELIAIEEARIDRLEKARQDSLEQQQRQAKIESALAATSALVNAVPLVIDLFKKGGLVGGLAGIASVIASIATLRAAVQKNTPTFHEGTSYADETGTATGGKLKSNEFMAKLERGEMIIPKVDSAHLRALGVKHTDILKLAESAQDKGVITLGDNLGQSKQLMEANNRIIAQNDKLLKYIKNLKTEVSIDERGLSIRQMRLQSKIKKRR